MRCRRLAGRSAGVPCGCHVRRRLNANVRRAVAVIRHIEGILLWGMGAVGLWWVFTLIAALLIRSPLMPVLTFVPLLLDTPLFWIQPGSSLDTPLPSFVIMGVFWGSVGHLVATHVPNRAAAADVRWCR